MSTLSAIRFVLIGTQEPGNIGSAVRAIHSMGIEDLILVRPAQFPHEKATMMAAGAADRLGEVRVVDTLDEALADCPLAIATSRRPRGIDFPALDIDETTDRIARVDGPAAIVFGPERSGLANADLFRCNYRSELPANPAFASLNLAQAVQLYAYAIRRRLTDTPPAEPNLQLATRASIESLHDHLGDLVDRLDFPNQDPNQITDRLRALFSRTDLTDADVRLLRGVLRRVDQRMKNPKDP